MHTDEHRIHRSIYDTARRRRTIRRSGAPLGDAFYVDLLGGREVWQTERKNVRGSRWFLIGETLIEVKAETAKSTAPIELEVDAPEELLTQAWDAGYVVDVREEDVGVTMCIVDPAGRRIHLVRRPRPEG